MDQTIYDLYKRKYRIFYSGAARGLDLLAAQRVLIAKQKYSDIKLIMVVPCADQTKRWTKQDSILHDQILSLADRVIVLSPHYWQGCMMVRNRYMVDRSSCCVCYMQENKGGTLSTVAYALKSQVEVINLAMHTDISTLSNEDLPF